MLQKDMMSNAPKKNLNQGYYFISELMDKTQTDSVSAEKHK